jgi:hypothetical protein
MSTEYIVNQSRNQQDLSDLNKYSKNWHKRRFFWIKKVTPFIVVVSRQKTKKRVTL